MFRRYFRQHTEKLWHPMMITWQWCFLYRDEKRRLATGMLKHKRLHYSDVMVLLHDEANRFWWLVHVMEVELYSLVNRRTEGAVVTDWPSWKRRGLNGFSFCSFLFPLLVPGRHLACPKGRFSKNFMLLMACTTTFHQKRYVTDGLPQITFQQKHHITDAGRRKTL